MKILIDMNLSPLWVDFLVKNGFVARHWSSIGAPNASDEVIFEWAVQNNYVNYF